MLLPVAIASALVFLGLGMFGLRDVWILAIGEAIYRDEVSVVYVTCVPDFRSGVQGHLPGLDQERAPAVAAVTIGRAKSDWNAMPAREPKGAMAASGP
ncbi:hypothetical protein ACIQVL_14365 [Streptomyces sp. NPDC090499]|uniref:hypothetical protein n=1 Tax=Streptomyces sp. NPDC090499 TaxID=3365965 RepID=UPI0038075C5A